MQAWMKMLMWLNLKARVHTISTERESVEQTIESHAHIQPISLIRLLRSYL